VTIEVVQQNYIKAINLDWTER